MTAVAENVAHLTSADVQFDDRAHVYTVLGKRVPSVTEILSAVGVSVDFNALAERSARTAAAIEAKRALGHALHADAHAFDDDDLEWDGVHPDVQPYLRAWATFRENTGLRPIARERRVFHQGAWFAGTLDGVFLTNSGVRVLIDIKTGDPESSGCRFQTAAYQAAYELEHPADTIQARWGVRLLPEREVPYDIHIYNDWRDWPAFQAFVTTYRHQAARRRDER